MHTFGKILATSLVISPFLKETVEIRSDLNNEDTVQIQSVDFFVVQSLWNNSSIRAMDKPDFYKSWFQMGISYVNQIEGCPIYPHRVESSKLGIIH